MESFHDGKYADHKDNDNDDDDIQYFKKLHGTKLTLLATRDDERCRNPTT